MLKRIVHVLAVLYVMTFLSGFLQATPFNFFNYIFFLLLFLGGIVLIRVTVESKAIGSTPDGARQGCRIVSVSHSRPMAHVSPSRSGTPRMSTMYG